ncbi:hypothetical protein M426DRAFT_14117 [Hypoxylon sp. CI-4A]|nr:hypothetical protein M426DRAFT_14117 [Hypoxylon sp. CI-4A]
MSFFIAPGAANFAGAAQNMGTPNYHPMPSMPLSGNQHLTNKVAKLEQDLKIMEDKFKYASTQWSVEKDKAKEYYEDNVDLTSRVAFLEDQFQSQETLFQENADLQHQLGVVTKQLEEAQDYGKAAEGEIVRLQVSNMEANVDKVQALYHLDQLRGSMPTPPPQPHLNLSPPTTPTQAPQQQQSPPTTPQHPLPTQAFNPGQIAALLTPPTSPSSSSTSSLTPPSLRRQRASKRQLSKRQLVKEKRDLAKRQEASQAKLKAGVREALVSDAERKLKADLEAQLDVQKAEFEVKKAQLEAEYQDKLAKTENELCDQVLAKHVKPVAEITVPVETGKPLQPRFSEEKLEAAKVYHRAVHDRAVLALTNRELEDAISQIRMKTHQERSVRQKQVVLTKEERGLKLRRAKAKCPFK